ncbi:MAG: VWA domain-containing protein [Spirochaetaceae bacterium]|jgi:Ca-activated chloride channel family protein|nr:VWA domain-containing protein [Spirochaetaceae bacterium]
MSVGFETPLVLCIGAVLLGFILIMSRFRKDDFVLSTPLGAPGGTSFKPPFGVDSLVRLLRAGTFAALVLLLVASGGPVFILRETVWLSRGADLVFILDVSPSMAGIDMNGKNRFEAARDLVRSFAMTRPQDALGLIALGADAVLLVPPTLDRGAFFTRLDGLQIGELGDGTAIGTALALASLHIRNFRASSRRSVILITDGENNAGSVHPENAAASLRSSGAAFWVIGLGGSGEVPIDYVDPVTKIQRTGIFDSRYDHDSLRTIANKGGGAYLAAPSAESFAAAFARLDSGELTIGRSGILRRRIPLHEPLIAAGVLLLFVVRMLRRHVLGALW